MRIKRSAFLFTAVLLTLAVLILPARAAEQSVPEQVFGQEAALLADGRLAERVALGQSVYIVRVTEVEAPTALTFEEREPASGQAEPQVLDIWDYTSVTVRGEIVGSETLDYRLTFGRDFTSRGTGAVPDCPDDGFPDPKVGDLLLVFDKGMQNGLTAVPPLWAGSADQVNSVVVMDGGGHCTVCLTGTPLERGSSAVPIE